MIRQKIVSVIKRLYPEIEVVKDKHIQALEQVINQRNRLACLPAQSPSLTIIIFSKDRAIQLHALLASFFDLVRGDANIKVLYTASTEGHAVSYDQLIKLCASRPKVSFEKEQDFQRDLLRTLETTHSSSLMFLVDDILFKEPLDLGDLLSYNTSCFVPSLRMSRHLNYSYTTRQDQPLPTFIKGIVPHPNVLIWRWEESKLDWAYPLSVDGHVFDTSELRSIIKSISFRAPNSLEEGMQLFNPIYKSRYGLAYAESVIMNIPNNKVQEENDNHAGNLSASDLLEKWQNGYQIDYKRLRHFINRSAHQEVELEFIKRTKSI